MRPFRVTTCRSPSRRSERARTPSPGISSSPALPRAGDCMPSGWRGRWDCIRATSIASGSWAQQALRAARLVVDPGLAVMGWSRQQAIDYMTTHVPISRAAVESEIDRYIANPGQATSYMIGRLEIERLRDEAKTRLGDKFDIREFHDRVSGERECTAVVPADPCRGVARR